MKTPQRNTPTNHPKEVWMLVHNRRLLAKLMKSKGVTHRDLAAAAGWSSHTYVGRIIRGEANTLRPDAAARIACYLGVGIDDLFVARMSTVTAQPVPQGGAAA